jgi:glycosyltransferase involved in cell wall biosynthesis
VVEKEISIILPAHNEALRIKKCIQETERAVNSFSSSYEIIVAEDGSTDGTEDIVADLAKGNRHISLLHSPLRLGKGEAIKRALRLAKGNVIVFMDVDLATNLSSLAKIVRLTQSHRGMTIGSRYVEGSKVQRGVSRSVFSLTYNLFVRILFLDGIHDHQCGFKAMSYEVAKVLLDKSKSNSFFFDTEIILLCKKLNFPVKEVEVEWTENRKKNESKVKLLPVAKRIGLDLLKFRLNKKDPEDC